MAEFGLLEGRRTSYSTRTRANAEAADGTVIFGNHLSKGSALTERYCNELGKQLLRIPFDGEHADVEDAARQLKARFVPNDNRDSDRSPDFRIVAGRSELGVAWREHTSGDTPREYFRVRLEDPALAEPISAAMFERPGSREAQLVWSFRRRG